MYSCRTGMVTGIDLKNIICEIEKVTIDHIRLHDNLTWAVINSKTNKNALNSSESLSNYFRKRKMQYNIVNDTLEKWEVQINDSLRFIKSANVRLNNGTYIYQFYNLEQSIFRFINSTVFIVQSNYGFDSNTNYYYDPDYFFVKPKYPIKIEYFGILKDSNYVFDNDLPLHFQNNYNACFDYFRNKYGLLIQKKFIINKNIDIKKINKYSDN
jgi:hypothetical protein